MSLKKNQVVKNSNKASNTIESDIKKKCNKCTTCKCKLKLDINLENNS
jgi:hypothetical protein